MSEERDVQQTPTGHEIPVPSRGEVFRDLAKVAKPPRKRGQADDDSDARGRRPQEQ